MAQNLVPNPSFEDTVNCEASVQCQLLHAEHWRNPNTATPDVWDCDLSRECGFGMDPLDEGIVSLGYQFAQDGLRLAGGYFWFGPGSSDTREYLMVQLNEPLIAGGHYRTSLYYSRSEGYMYAVDHLGVWFGADSLWENTPNWLGVSPQVRLRDPNSNYLLQGDAWVQLVDTLVAQGGERWMVIGNFDVAGAVNGIVANATSSYPYAYYYFDLVSVVPLEVNNGMAESTLAVQWSVDGLWLNWSGSAPLEQLSVFDMAGHCVFSQQERSARSPMHLALPSMAQGVYMVNATGSGWSATSRVLNLGD